MAFFDWVPPYEIWWYKSCCHAGEQLGHRKGDLKKNTIKNLYIDFIMYLKVLLMCTVLLFYHHLSIYFFLPDSVHRSPGHLWLWGLWEQQLWTVLHQLCQWTAPALLQPAHLQIRAGRVLFFHLLSFLVWAISAVSLFTNADNDYGVPHDNISMHFLFFCLVDIVEKKTTKNLNIPAWTVTVCFDITLLWLLHILQKCLSAFDWCHWWSDGKDLTGVFLHS